MTGPIRGARLSAEVKRFIVRAVTEAKAKGMPIAKSCEILMIDARRVRRWIAGVIAGTHRTSQTRTRRGATTS